MTRISPGDPLVLRRDIRFIVNANSIDRFRISIGPDRYSSVSWPWIYEFNLSLVSEPDTGLYGASLTRLIGLAGILGTYVESPATEEADQPRTSELGPASTQTALATVFFLAGAQAAVSRLYNGGDPRVDTRDYEDVLVRVPMSFEISGTEA